MHNNRGNHTFRFPSVGSQTWRILRKERIICSFNVYNRIRCVKKESGSGEGKTGERTNKKKNIKIQERHTNSPFARRLAVAAPISSD